MRLPHTRRRIHRDINPVKILVTQSLEGAAMPMVIDVGVAKATTNQRLTDKNLFTAFEMLIGTPAYMSPEQAALTSVDVDTRTDIYSLGVWVVGRRLTLHHRFDWPFSIRQFSPHEALVAKAVADGRVGR